MTQVYQFVDDNGVTRLFAEIVPDPAGTPFNGGTITSALTITPTDPAVASMFTVQAPAGAEANGDLLMRLDSDITAHIWVDTDATVFVTNTSLGGVAAVQVTDAIGTLIAASGGETSPLRLSITGTGDVFRVVASGAVITAAHAAPADGALATGECALWFDQTNGASKLMVKAKQADGAVKTAAIALS